MINVPKRCRIPRFIACCVLVVALLVCGSPAGATEPTPLRLWNYWPEDVRNAVYVAMREMFVRFVEQHPQIDVQTTRSMAMIGGGNEATRLMAFAGGSGPDVLLLNTQQLPGYIEQGLLSPLDAFMDSETYESWDVVPDGFWDAAQVDGRAYAVPAPLALPEISSSFGDVAATMPQTGTLALIYRKDMFLEVGLDPDRPPETWEEFADYARRLTRNDVTISLGVFAGARHDHVYGAGMVVGREAGYHFANWLWQAGGRLAELRDGRWQATFNDEAGLQALRFLHELRWQPFEREGERFDTAVLTAPMSSDDPAQSLQRKFVTGEVAMILDQPSAYQELAFSTPEAGFTAANIGVAPLPAGPAGRAHIAVPLCWTITSQRDDPAIRQAAWTFIQYVTAEETARHYLETAVENGVGAMMRPDHLAHFGFDQEYELIDEEFRTIIEELAPSMRLEPPIPGWQHVSEVELATAVSKALTEPRHNPEALLNEAAHRANRLLFGAQDEQSGPWARVTAGAVVVLTVLLMVFVFHKVVQTFRGTQSHLIQQRARPRTHLVAWLYMLPAVLSLLVWGYLPLARGLHMAFYDYKLFGENTMIGLENFVNVFTQPLFWEVMGNTLYYVGLTLAFGFFAPLILAILLTEIPKGKYFFRAVYYLPAVIAPVVALLMWRTMIYGGGEWGVLNRLLGMIGVGPNNWLQDPRFAMICVVIATIWGSAGPASLIYIAALKSIPEEQYEAADIDSAGALRKILHITLPTIMPLVIMNFVGAVIAAFQASENIFVMTEGGPNNATRVIGIEIFYNAFLYLKFGYATAMAWIMGSILLGFTIINLRVLRNVEFTRAN